MCHDTKNAQTIIKCLNYYQIVKKLGIVHFCTANTREAEIGESRVQDQLGWYVCLQANLGHITKPCLELKGRQVVGLEV